MYYFFFGQGYSYIIINLDVYLVIPPYCVIQKGGGHLLFIRRRYYLKHKNEEGGKSSCTTTSQDAYQCYYECMNSAGLENPYPVYATNDDNIIKLFKVTVKATPIIIQNFGMSAIQEPRYKHAQTETANGELFKEDLL